MVLHKQVNGERIQLSEEEEAAVCAEWAKNELVSVKQGEVQALVEQMPSVEERLLTIEACMFDFANNPGVSMSQKNREDLKKSIELQPRIEAAKAALQAQEKENGE